MPETHLSSELLTLEDLLTASSAATGLHGFRGFQAGHPLCFRSSRDELPAASELKALAGLTLGSVVVEGSIESEEESFVALRRLFEQAADLGKLGMLAVFAELDADDGFPDELRIFLMRGEALAGCYTGQPKVQRPAILQRVIDGFGLPVEIAREDESYSLRHTAGGTLRASGGEGGGRNPNSFRAQIPGLLPGELAGRLERVASARAEELIWRVQPLYDGRQLVDMPEGRQILERILELRPGADSFEIEIHVAMKSLDDVEALGSLCRGDDSLVAPFGTVKDTQGKSAALEVWTTATGHRLALETRDPEFPKVVGQALGFSLKPHSEIAGSLPED